MSNFATRYTPSFREPHEHAAQEQRELASLRFHHAPPASPRLGAMIGGVRVVGVLTRGVVLSCQSCGRRFELRHATFQHVRRERFRPCLCSTADDGNYEC